jgi:NADP-dependent 3-hydroxy acid dehydrogenase YdfG
MARQSKVVVITGASSGLAEKPRHGFSPPRARPSCSVRQDRIKTLVETLARAGGKALAVTTDVTDRAQVNESRASGQAQQLFNRLSFRTRKMFNPSTHKI